MSGKIKKITAEEILDSRGNPTLEVSVITDGAIGVFDVPSGASTGVHEAHELRDGDDGHFHGLGVKKAIEKVQTAISPALEGLDVSEQKKIDSTMLELDGTVNKINLGGNSMIGVSIACAKAAAKEENIETFEYLRRLNNIPPSSRPTPLLYMNLVNGGKHTRTRLTFQEYHVVPQIDDTALALEIGVNIQQQLKELIIKEVGAQAAGLGDEGGFAPDIESVRKPLEFLAEAIDKTGNKDRVRLALDAAASSFFSNGAYNVGPENLSPEMLFDLYSKLIKDFNIFSIEDPFFEEDFSNFQKLLLANPGLMVVGDDLTVTNDRRLKIAIDQKSINAIIIKPNQIGTLTETLLAMALARENGIECIVSHRSGETNDDFIADLAFAFNCFGLKAGAPQRGERVAKYNRLVHLADLTSK